MSIDKRRKDELFIERLELMNEYIVQKYQLEKLVKSGCLHLAKARYVGGRPNYVTTLQLPTNDTDKYIKAQYTVKLMKDDKLETKEFDKENDVNKENVNETPKAHESEKASSEKNTDIIVNRDTHFELIKQEDVKNNPLKWFGVLVPQSLRTAQTDFEKCIELTVSIANLQLKLKSLESNLK